MQRPGSEPTRSFALSIARQDGVQTLATCGSATLCSNANIGSTTSLLETCFIAFFCMVVMPLIGACGGVVCQLVAAVTVAMLSTIIAVGFKYALSTDNGSVHRLTVFMTMLFKIQAIQHPRRSLLLELAQIIQATVWNNLTHWFVMIRTWLR